jgi:hypothetical protein
MDLACLMSQPSSAHSHTAWSRSIPAARGRRITIDRAAVAQSLNEANRM